MSITFYYKALLLVYILLIKEVGIKQNSFFLNSNNSDSLSKYSYLLTAYLDSYDRNKETNIEESATGFFVRRNKRLFFVLARHTATKRNLYPPFTHAIWLTKYKGGKDLRLLDFNQAETLPDFKKYQEPDVYVTEVNALNNYPVNSIEKFINWENTTYNEGDTGVLYSYHFQKFDSNRNINKCSLKIKNNKNQYLRTSNFVDSINYFLEMTSIGAGPGSSGGPIFIKKNDHWQFGGICISGSIEKREMLAVRPEVVIKLVEEKLK